MHTIRGRLVFWYAVALGATMFLYSLTIYLVRRSQILAELDDRARLEADVVAALLGVAHRERGGAVAKDPETGRMAISPQVVPQLSVIPDYVVVLDSARQVLYLSTDARALPFASLERLRAGVVLADSATFGQIRLDAPSGEIRYYSRSIKGAGPLVRWVVSGASTAGRTLGPRRLFVQMFVIALVILPISTLIGYLLVGRTLEPVDRMVDEVEAITDGRSLHRRLVELKTGDELARLSSTLNAMLARLERSFVSLRRFTADASHELKTPLTVLRSGIERAITHPETSPEVLEVLEETLIEVNRMTEMVDSLLMLARADEGRAPLHLEAVDLREILREVAETAGILGEQASVSVSVSIPAEPTAFPADRARIRQLFMNLLTNAIKYTPRGGSVWIESVMADGQVTLQVRDTGVGIAPGDLPHIFDRFWRADAARRRTGERPGAGLGLAICKWIAEAHGGTIAVQSRTGRGTTFTVTLPVGAGAPAPEAAAAP
ncbi:MAG: HAMP domain-containing protein [Gemmatimonadetes bacterium]|nr:HAMP domain-containing protein [Gemmatimonadota bacterium]